LVGEKCPPVPLPNGRRLTRPFRGAARAASRWIVVAVFALPLVARAALFDDDEARRQISRLKTQIEISQKALEERLSAVAERLSQMDAAGRDRAVDLVQLIDALKQDMAKLRGQIEILVNQAENLDRHQKDLYVDLDNRLRKLEQAQAQIQDKLGQGERDATAEKQTYEAALNQFKVGNYQMAITGFQSFMANFPNSQFAPNAQYWTGNAHFQMRDYKAAIAAQQKVISVWPDNPKAPDAMLDMASYQAEMGDSKSARETLGALIKKFPSSPAAEKAKQRLARK
jgi:tol-pal system protein YbgF